MRLPVYLIHWDAPDWCRSASLSILASQGVLISLSVVDNGQTTGPLLRETLPEEVRVIKMPVNKGYTGGANAALADWRDRHPGSEFCVIGSHDLHVHRDALATLVSVATSRPDAGIVGPALTAPLATSGGSANRGRFPQLPLDGAPEIAVRDWAVGACLLLRRECVDEVGSFDERFGSYCEDVDYGLRANDRGWKVLVATKARAYGLGSSSIDSVKSKAANSVILQAKRGGLRAGVMGFSALAVLTARGLGGWIAPWRPPNRRAISRSWALQRLSAMGGLLTSMRLIDAMRDGQAPADRRAVRTS